MHLLKASVWSYSMHYTDLIQNTALQPVLQQQQAQEVLLHLWYAAEVCPKVWHSIFCSSSSNNNVKRSACTPSMTT